MPFITSQRDGTCSECGDDFSKGDRIYYDGAAFCQTCGTDVDAKTKNAQNTSRSQSVKKVTDRYK